MPVSTRATPAKSASLEANLQWASARAKSSSTKAPASSTRGQPKASKRKTAKTTKKKALPPVTLFETLPPPTIPRKTVTFREENKIARSPAPIIDLAISPIAEEESSRTHPPQNLSPVAMAKIPSPPPSRPAGVVARKAALASALDSRAARMAARRMEKQEERRNTNAGGAQPAGLSGGAVASELERMRIEREARVSKLFAQLDKLSNATGATKQPSTETTALVCYEGVGLLNNDYQTTVLLNLMRGADSREWLQNWLKEEPGRVEQIRATIEKAPPQLQTLLVSVLSRRLESVSGAGGEEDEDEKGALLTPEQEQEVRVTLMGGKALMASHKTAGCFGGAKEYNNEEKPLPRPIIAQKTGSGTCVKAAAATAAPAPLLLLTYRPEEQPIDLTSVPTGGVEEWVALDGGAFVRA